MAAACLVDGITYEPDGPRLIKTGMQILDREPWRQMLQLDPVPAMETHTAEPCLAGSAAPAATTSDIGRNQGSE